MQIIESPNNALVKHFVKLREERRYRSQQGTVLIIGEKTIREICSNIEAVRLMLPHSGCDLEKLHPPKEILLGSESVLKKATGQQSPDGWLAEVPIPPSNQELGSRILILDKVQDPGNLGTLLRTALALNWTGVWVLDGTVDPFNDKALRASKGAPFRLPIRCGPEENLFHYLAKRDFSLFVADMDGKEVSALKIRQPFALMLGNEGAGVSDRFKSEGTAVAIPMPGEMESLNVAVAGGILMYLFNRSSI